MSSHNYFSLPHTIIITLITSSSAMVNISPRKKVARTQLKADQDNQEQQIQAALLDLSKGTFRTIKAAAQHYHLPYQTLHHCKQGRKSCSEAFKGLQALLPEAEEVLVQHICKCADFGLHLGSSRTWLNRSSTNTSATMMPPWVSTG